MAFDNFVKENLTQKLEKLIEDDGVLARYVGHLDERFVLDARDEPWEARYEIAQFGQIDRNRLAACYLDEDDLFLVARVQSCEFEEYLEFCRTNRGAQEAVSRLPHQGDDRIVEVSAVSADGVEILMIKCNNDALAYPNDGVRHVGSSFLCFQTNWDVVRKALYHIVQMVEDDEYYPIN